MADPLGGSYFVEALTDEVERQAEEIFAHLDELGSGSILEGVIKGIEENWFQGKIGDSSYELERKFNADRRTIIGVNRFTEGNDEDQIDLLQITNEDEARQIKRLDAVRHDRDEATVAEALARLARGGRRPGDQPHADPHRHREDLRQPRRDHGHAGRRLRAPRRGAHDLTSPV